jgi:hypothetical protein
MRASYLPWSGSEHALASMGQRNFARERVGLPTLVHCRSHLGLRRRYRSWPRAVTRRLAAGVIAERGNEPRRRGNRGARDTRPSATSLFVRRRAISVRTYLARRQARGTLAASRDAMAGAEDRSAASASWRARLDLDPLLCGRLLRRVRWGDEAAHCLVGVSGPEDPCLAGKEEAHRRPRSRSS